MKDALGVEIRDTDRVRITSWGSARLVDVGTVSPVVRFTRTRVVVFDSEAYQRAVDPREVSVLRRDNVDGLEGNRPKCTCGADFLSGCFCNITPRDFYIQKGTLTY